MRFAGNTTVTDMAITTTGEGDARNHTVTGLTLLHDGVTEDLAISPDTLVFYQNGSMTDATSLGTHDAPPPRLTKADSQGWALWEKIAQGRPEFGNPAAFNTSIPESLWQSFTVTCRNPRFFEAMQALSGNEAGTGGLVTFKDSRWLMSVVLYHQPHFRTQTEGVQVFWGYALHPDRVGDFVAKPMSECSGAEILRELCGHLNFDPGVFDEATCIPCRLPYITSMFMPRKTSDRPLPVPRGSRNLGFISQFVEIPDDVVFTVEYSVRAAQIAVYALTGVSRPIPPVTRHDHDLHVLASSLAKALA